MVVTLTALVWTALMWALPSYIDVPMPALSAAAMALFATKCLKTLLLYPPKVRSGFRGAMMASVAGLRSPMPWARRCGQACSPRASRSCVRPNALTRPS